MHYKMQQNLHPLSGTPPGIAFRQIPAYNHAQNITPERPLSMSEYQELVKSFQKSRNYVRDFLIYGFKSREDFSVKSGRTYDNERRRIESWLSEYIQADYGPQGKTLSLRLDSNLLGTNPLFRVWRSKSFTANDLMLHFFFLDLFREDASFTADELADRILKDYGVLLEPQLIRKKANEYVKEGILTSRKDKKRLLYSMEPEPARALPGVLPALLDAVRFCQLTMPLGFIGSTILDGQKAANTVFLVKHGYYGFTLEDEVLFRLLQAMHRQQAVTVRNRSNKTLRPQEEIFHMVPLKIFVSTRTGRRFLCGYQMKSRRFSTLRLDQIQQVTAEGPFDEYICLHEKLEQNLPSCFGVSFGASHEMDTLKLTLHIREGTEDYILQRLRREGRDGIITRVEQDIWTYEKTVFDGNELMPWIKTFLGRILSFASSNAFLEQKFYRDVQEMARMYRREE